jgi:hypothetical protein
MRAPTGGERLAPPIAALSVAFVAVAAAGAGAEVGGNPRVPNAPAAVLVAAEWLAAFLLLGLAATTAAILLFMRSRHPMREPREQSLVARLTGIVLAGLAIAGIAIAMRAARLSTHTATSPPSLLRPSAPQSRPPARVTSNSAHLPPFAWGWFAFAGSVVLVLVGVAFVVSNMRRARVPSSPFRGQRDHRGDDDALVAAATSAEPRLAGRRADALMRRTLAARGVDSDDSDAPGEYARRVSGVLPDLAHPIIQLTQLYERARFSSLEVSEEAKRSALASLHALRPEQTQ